MKLIKKLKVKPQMKRQQHINHILLIFSFLGIISFQNCDKKMERKKIYRDLDIQLMFFDADKYVEYRSMVASGDSNRLIDVFNEMDRVLQSEKIADASSNGEYRDVFDFDESLRAANIETYDYIQKSYISDSDLIKKPGFEILQYVMLYVSSAYNRNKFYYNFVYNPPAEFSFAFSDFYAKWNNASSYELETFNPFTPFCEDPGVEQGIHYVMLSNDMAESIIEKVGDSKKGTNSKAGLKSDHVFLTNALHKTIEGKWKCIVLITP